MHSPARISRMQMMAALSAGLLTAVLGCSPQSDPPVSSDPPAAASSSAPVSGFAGPIEQAHRSQAWRSKKALRANLRVDFGGQTILDGSLLMDTPGGLSRIELKDGTVAVFDGREAWVSPSGSQMQRARFHLLTWPYFLAAPYKLTDPGAKLEEKGRQQLQGKTYETALLTFEAGTGDTPEDWYLLYRDQASSQLYAMAYIVTYGTDAEEAAADPHAVTYHQFTEVDGVPIPTQWDFWTWREGQGIVGEQLGQVIISDVRFVEPGPADFVKPPDSRADALPQG